jgi:hypothetical protein
LRKSPLGAPPHKKSNRNEPMPHIENVTQIILGMPNGGRPYRGNHEKKTGGNRGIYSPVSISQKLKFWESLRYHRAAEKAKPAPRDGFTRLTGRRGKSALRRLNAQTVAGYAEGKAVQRKPEKKRPANRKGKLPAPLMRRRTRHLAGQKISAARGIASMAPFRETA